MGFPIRKSSDRCVCATPRSLSQLITSFFASQTQGIHRVLLVTLKIWISYPRPEAVFNWNFNFINLTNMSKNFCLKPLAFGRIILLSVFQAMWIIQMRFVWFISTDISINIVFKERLAFGTLWVPPCYDGFIILWRISESNRLPPACKAGALAKWANPPLWVSNNVVPRRLELRTSTLSV
jgi:hypothetical protein